MNWLELLINEQENGEFKNWLNQQNESDIIIMLRNVYDHSIRNVYSDMRTSSKIGKIGEKVIMNMLRPYVVQDTAYDPHAGDITISYKGKPFIIEVKNYSKTVPTKECDKFIRDVSESYCVGGIIIALGTKIARKKNLELEYHEKPCLFISNPPSKDYILCCIDLMYKVCSETIEGNLEQHIEIMNNVCYKMGLIREKITTMQKQTSDIIIELWKQQENILKSLSTFSVDVSSKVDPQKIDYYNHPDYMRVMISSILNISNQDSIIIKTGNKYKWKDNIIEILKTKVYYYTKSDVTPQNGYIYRNGIWKIPLNKITFPIINNIVI